jgi:dTDP-glucose pyrophosphorylase
MCDLNRFLVTADDTLRTVIARIDRNAQGVALVIDDQSRLLATITDGDVRRAMLAGLELDASVSTFLLQRARAGQPPPVTAPQGTAQDWLLSVMRTYSLRHIPLLDGQGRVVDLALLSEFSGELALPVTAVVMAGGYGTRLRPLTNKLPKPMLPVGNRPLLERLVGQLKDSGVRRILMTTHYRPDEITGHFGDGARFGVDITYRQESQPLGTAGGLRQMDPGVGPLLVLNGDILTGVDFRAMLEFHREQRAEMTVAVRRVENQLPYGVIETEQAQVISITEKPTFRYLANAGIYLLERTVCAHIPDGQAFQMTELIARLLAEHKRVAGFLIREYWLDIGQPEDYQQALLDHEERRVS